MTEENKVEVYIEDKKIVSVEPSGKETPLQDPIFTVTFEDGSKAEMTSARFKSVQTIEKSDATTARNTMVKEVGQRIYSLFMEYGIKLPEIDPCLNEVVRLCNDAQTLAEKELWGNEPYDRSLLDINAILLNKYGQKENKKTQRILMDLHPAEAMLIQQLRSNYRYGEVRLRVKDGLPIRIEARVEKSLFVSTRGDTI